MSTADTLLMLGSVLLPLGLFSLMLGLKIMRCKPVLVLQKRVRRAVLLSFLPMWFIVAVRLVESSARSVDVASSLMTSLLALAVIPAVSLLFALLVAHGSWLFNVTGATLVEGVEEVLQDQGFEYALRQRTTPVWLGGLPQVVVDLPDWNGAITATVSVLGRVSIRVQGKRRIPDWERLLTGFAHAIADQEYEGSTAAFQFLIAAAVSLGLVVYGISIVL